MSDKKESKVKFDSNDSLEQKLWTDLGDLPRESPSGNLRRSFFRDLEQATASRWTDRLQNWLGFSDGRGWVTMAASILIVLGLGYFQGEPADSERARLLVLEEKPAESPFVAVLVARACQYL